jgi:hypothetical protein
MIEVTVSATVRLEIDGMNTTEEIPLTCCKTSIKSIFCASDDMPPIPDPIELRVN